MPLLQRQKERPVKGEEQNAFFVSRVKCSLFLMQNGLRIALGIPLKKKGGFSNPPKKGGRGCPPSVGVLRKILEDGAPFHMPMERWGGLNTIPQD